MAKRITDKNLILLCAILAVVQSDDKLHKAVAEIGGHDLVDKVQALQEQADDMDVRYADPYKYADVLVSIIKGLVK